MFRAHVVDVALKTLKATFLPMAVMAALAAAPARAAETLIDFSDQSASFSTPTANPLIYPNLKFSSVNGMRVFSFTSVPLDRGLCPHATNACRSELIIDIVGSISELRFDVFQVDIAGQSLRVLATGLAGSDTRMVPLTVGFAANSITLSSLTGVTRLVLDGTADEEGVIYDNFRFEASGAPVASVPEPATWGMLVMGFGLLGVALRTRPRIA